MSARLQRLVESAMLLSASAEEQLQTLADMGIPEVVDELVLNFDDDVIVVDSMVKEGELDFEAKTAAAALNRHLEEMSGEANAHLWTPEALRTSPEWIEVRRLAARLLDVVGRKTQRSGG
jgi:hypothetical protein